MISISLSLALVASLAGLQLALAAPDHAVTVGCISQDTFDPDNDNNFVSDFNYVGQDPRNPARCATACAQGQGDNYPGRMWTYGVLLDDSSDAPLCLCSDAPAPANGMVTGNQATGNCAPGGLWYWTFPTTWNFRGCYTTVDPNSGLATVPLYTGRAGPKECMSLCRYSRYMSAFADPNNAANWNCYCAESSIPAMNPADQCDADSYYAYEHVADSAASGFTKRQLNQRFINGKWTRANGFCPQGLTACNIPNTDHFECIDTNEELESCGGCAHGEYKPHKNATVPTGVNCLAQPGIKLGGATCANGKCRVSACQDGWILENGGCRRR